MLFTILMNPKFIQYGGLPASSFRTDNWHIETVSNKTFLIIFYLLKQGKRLRLNRMRLRIKRTIFVLKHIFRLPPEKFSDFPTSALYANG